MKTNKEKIKKIINVSDIKKTNSSYGNYAFRVDLIIKGRFAEIKTNKTEFGFNNKELNKLREEYLKLK